MAWETPHPDDIREMERQRAARMARRMMRLASEGVKPAGDKRRRALGVLKWAENKWAATPVGQRDEAIKDAIYFLGAFVNEDWLTHDEVLDTILAISEATKHLGGNKSQYQIERDVDRGLEVAARDGITVDWEGFDD